ncbi:Nuclear pore complex protein Nup98-Nup96, partial [Grifola frondosa]
MARFRAYSTDSEDDDDVSVSSAESKIEVDRELDLSDAESESIMDEEELLGPSGETASDGESSGEESQEDREKVRKETRIKPTVRFTASTRSPPRATADPTIIPWAREIGVEAQKMHVMQTSMFRMPEEDAVLRTLNEPQSRGKDALLHRKHSRDSEGDGARGESLQRTSFADDIERVSHRPSRKYARVVTSASAVNGNENAFVDAGLALGRSFRVGWGPGGTIVHLGDLCGPFGSPKSSANSSTLKKTTISLTTETSQHASRLLSHHLSNTLIEDDADGIPFANPSPSLFHLGHALFDQIDLHLSESTRIDIRNRVSILRRKAELSKWLRNAVSPSVDSDLRDSLNSDWAATLFTLLSGYQIEKACEVAMDSGNVKIASLISQCPGDAEFREDLRHQLTLWREQRIDVHMNENARKIYALLAGIVDILEGSNGAGIEECPDLLLAQRLDWKRAFGLHLWFGEPIDAPIAQAFDSYDRLSKRWDSGVAPPRPWYAKGHSSAEPPDALYSLIKLFTDPTCSLSTILSPKSFSASPLDYRLPWHLYIILSRCLRIRDLADREAPPATDEEPDEEEPSVEGHSPSADLLANSYASQLEQAGMIQEAVFVLLHIEGSAGRKMAIKELLTRCAAQLDDWVTRGLVGSLKIPISWLNEAKVQYFERFVRPGLTSSQAIHSLDKGDVYGAYKSYLAAGLYGAAHDLAVLELAPDAVNRQDLALLNEIFSVFDGSLVDGWHVRGKAFLDYAHAMIRLPQLYEDLSDHDAVPDASEYTELEQFTRSVPKLIGILPDLLPNTSDVRHITALTEMTAGLAAHLDRVKPLALVRYVDASTFSYADGRFQQHQSQVRTQFMSDAVRIHNIHSTAFEKFLRTIEVALPWVFIVASTSGYYR